MPHQQVSRPRSQISPLHPPTAPPAPTLMRPRRYALLCHCRVPNTPLRVVGVVARVRSGPQPPAGRARKYSLTVAPCGMEDLVAGPVPDQEQLEARGLKAGQGKRNRAVFGQLGVPIRDARTGRDVPGGCNTLAVQAGIVTCRMLPRRVSCVGLWGRGLRRLGRRGGPPASGRIRFIAGQRPASWVAWGNGARWQLLCPCAQVHERIVRIVQEFEEGQRDGGGGGGGGAAAALPPPGAEDDEEQELSERGLSGAEEREGHGQQGGQRRRGAGARRRRRRRELREQRHGGGGAATGAGEEGVPRDDEEDGEDGGGGGGGGGASGAAWGGAAGGRGGARAPISLVIRAARQRGGAQDEDMEEEEGGNEDKDVSAAQGEPHFACAADGTARRPTQPQPCVARCSRLSCCTSCAALGALSCEGFADAAAGSLRCPTPGLCVALRMRVTQGVRGRSTWGRTACSSRTTGS